MTNIAPYPHLTLKDARILSRFWYAWGAEVRKEYRNRYSVWVTYKKLIQE